MTTRNIDRTNDSNDGRGFEHEIELTVNGYEQGGRARLRKVSPPARVVGGGAFRRILFLENPFLDFVGTWTERGGRAIFVEAKSTSEHRLRLARDGGLTEKQFDAMKAWHGAGAAVGVLWHRADLRRSCFLSHDALVTAAARGDKSILWGEPWDPVEPARGFVLHDFLSNLARAYPI